MTKGPGPHLCGRALACSSREESEWPLRHPVGAARVRTTLGEGLAPSLTRLKKLSARWSWVARARAWDASVGRERDHAAVRSAVADAAKWGRRRRLSLARNWKLAA